jgi:hypothetical protein
MLSLPKSTELSKQLPKKTIYLTFKMNTTAKEKFDADIKKLVIVNELSTTTTVIIKGNDVAAIYVVLVSLKRDTFDERNIGLISRLINQKMIYILEYNGNAKLASYHTKLIHTDWKPIDEWTIQLKGLNFDDVWENIVIQIGDVKLKEGNTLGEQLLVDFNRQKLLKEITMLEKQARSESQPRRKFEIVQKIKLTQKELGE